MHRPRLSDHRHRRHYQRRIIAAVEIKHRVLTVKATMTTRRQHGRTRCSRLRYRAPRHDNRCRKPVNLPPSVDSLRVDTLRVVNTMLQVYPITGISIELNKFDTQLMMNPDIKGVEYQLGTLFGWSGAGVARCGAWCLWVVV